MIRVFESIPRNDIIFASDIPGDIVQPAANLRDKMVADNIVHDATVGESLMENHCKPVTAAAGKNRIYILVKMESFEEFSNFCCFTLLGQRGISLW